MSSRKAVSTTTKVRGDRRILLILLIVPLVLAAIWFFFTSPANDAAAQEQQALEASQAQASAAATKLQAVKAGKGTDAAQLLASARKLDQQLPPTAAQNPIVFGTQLTTIARSAGVSVSSFTKADEKTVAGAKAQTYDAVITGPRQNVMSFMARLSATPQLVTLPKVAYVFSAGDTTVTITMLVWSLPEPELGAGK